jgi:hypothetical protein
MTSIGLAILSAVEYTEDQKFVDIIRGRLVHDDVRRPPHHPLKGAGYPASTADALGTRSTASRPIGCVR